jgi:hypothetical protein
MHLMVTGGLVTAAQAAGCAIMIHWLSGVHAIVIQWHSVAQHHLVGFGPHSRLCPAL